MIDYNRLFDGVAEDEYDEYNDHDGFDEYGLMREEPHYMTPTEFLDDVNDTLMSEYGGEARLEGEVASYKENQGKWVFFDLKDEESSVSCFLPLWELRVPLEDGMKIAIKARPKVTKGGKFSLTVESIKPVGEGSLKKAYEMLKKKLTKEGLFSKARKRPIPEDLTRLGVISSIGAAGYADFVKIINARWGGMKVFVAHTQVQGMDASDQIIRALRYFNERGGVQMIAILRGGGSADDLSCFNDEKLVREIAASKIPVITGIGHEVDESLADLAADVRASTPSNAAEMLTRDRVAELNKLFRMMQRAEQSLTQEIGEAKSSIEDKVDAMRDKAFGAIELAAERNREQLRRGLNLVNNKYIEPMLKLNEEKTRKCLDKLRTELNGMVEVLWQKLKLLEVLNPEKVLEQGYAILAGKISPGNVVKITTFKQEIEAEVKKVKERS